MDKAERKAYIKEHFRNPYEIGEMLHNSWGYDQTNCEFYQVVAKTRATVTLKPVQAESIEGSEGFMCERLVPVKDAFCESFLGALRRYAGMGTEIRMKVSAYLGNDMELHYYIPTNHGSCRKWDGTPKYSSHYV